MQGDPPKKIDDDQTDESGAELVAPAVASEEAQKEVYDRARGTLEFKDLATKAGIRLMVQQIDDLKSEVENLSAFREQYYKADGDLRVERERAGLSKLTENVSSAMLAAGSAGASIVASFFQKNNLSIALFIVFVAIAVGSFLLRVKSR